MRFRTTVELGGKSATGLPVPETVVTALSSKRRFPVTVTLGEHTYRSSVVFYQGKFMIALSAENRTAAGVSAGDDVDVEIELDTEVREVVVPADLAEALRRKPQAAAAFEALSYSMQRGHVMSVDGAKTDATRTRRIDKIVGDLAG